MGANMVDHPPEGSVAFHRPKNALEQPVTRGGKCKYPTLLRNGWGQVEDMKSGLDRKRSYTFLGWQDPRLPGRG